MRLPVAQRSGVILMDVLGCSLQEICEVMDFSLAAVKAALHRGRTRLRELADEPDDLPRPKLSEADRDCLGVYVAHFNARDFDAIRPMIGPKYFIPLQWSADKVAIIRDFRHAPTSSRVPNPSFDAGRLPKVAAAKSQPEL